MLAIVWKYTTFLDFTAPVETAQALRSLPLFPARTQNAPDVVKVIAHDEDERPFTKADFNARHWNNWADLRRISWTCLHIDEEAINNLGSSKFSQSNRDAAIQRTHPAQLRPPRPPLSPMPRRGPICQRFVDLRTSLNLSQWQSALDLPLKGRLLQFTRRVSTSCSVSASGNGITARHVMMCQKSPRNTMQLVNLERDTDSDKLSHDRATIEVIFCRFAGQDGQHHFNSEIPARADHAVGVKVARSGSF
ncbi:hypothetical protein N7497_012380 [Penicillium chrysogenum]|nr:hypothetical protein N7497_012380 [Penicillium chrysogenum]